MRLIIKLSLTGSLLTLLLAACNLPQATPDAAATMQAFYTAQATSGVTVTPAAVLPTITFPTLPPFTAAPSLTPQPPTAPAPTTYCDWAAFVSDISVPDGTSLSPGGQFTKTWRLKNIGTCAWTSAYTLIFSSGDNLGGGAISFSPSGQIGPGQFVDVSVNLTAPTQEGTYRAYWKLRNGAGSAFGLGAAAQDAFYVEIKVVGGMTKVFDFAGDYCKATWHSGAGDLSCPGDTNGKKGYALKLDNPQLENGQAFNGSGLLTVPENVNNGYLQGSYPAFTIQRGDRFRALINCQYQAPGCNAVFRLDFQIGSSQPQTIWQFVEAYEGKYYTVDTDLSALAGNQVKFILTVLSNGAAENDRPVWIAPRIDRPSNLVTPSAVPTVTATATLSATSTATPTLTVTNTATNTATATSTPTATLTATATTGAP